MQHKRRTLRHLTACALAACTLLPAVAQEARFPERPINFVVPFSPGGPTDVMARLIAAELTTVLGQSVIVENRPGAGGNIGADHVARAKPDGYTLLFGTSGPLAINHSLYRNITYNPATSFAPVIRVGHLPNVLVVHPDLSAGSVQELVALDKAKPASLNYASSGNGASSHLAGVLFNNMAGTQLQHIPYKGSTPAIADMLGGQLDFMFDVMPTAQPLVKSGRFRALAVTTLKRSDVLPDVPTLDELGYKGFDASSWFSLMAPAGTPKTVVMQINAAVNEVLRGDAMRGRLASIGASSEGGTPEQLDQFVKAETARWKQLIDERGIR